MDLIRRFNFENKKKEKSPQEKGRKNLTNTAAFDKSYTL